MRNWRNWPWQKIAAWAVALIIMFQLAALNDKLTDVLNALNHVEDSTHRTAVRLGDTLSVQVVK